jgi:hypothetical protein
MRPLKVRTVLSHYSFFIENPEEEDAQLEEQKVGQVEDITPD